MTKGIGIDTFEQALSTRYSEVKDLKLSALEELKKQGIPSRRQETWKYTDASSLVPDRIQASASDSSLDIQQMISQALPEPIDSYSLVLLNGYFLKESSDKNISEDLEVTDNTGSFEALPVLADKPFVCMNLAAGDCSLKLKLKAGKTLDKPVVIYSLITSSAADAGIFPRVLVEAEESASISVIEVPFCVEDINYQSISLCECRVADNARLSYHLINRHSKQAAVYNALASVQGRDSVFTAGVFNFGGKLTRNEIYSELAGQNARSELLGLSVLEDSQHVDNHTVLDHAIEHCESFELFKGIYGDSSKGIFDGTIIVRPDAQKTNAIQSNQSLLLSDSATSNAKPQLKIWADDVKCTHGATVGQLDMNAMFYLQSRGIGQKDARSMLIHAFASEVISEIKEDSLQNALESLLSEKLEKI